MHFNRLVVCRSITATEPPLGTCSFEFLKKALVSLRLLRVLSVVEVLIEFNRFEITCPKLISALSDAGMVGISR